MDAMGCGMGQSIRKFWMSSPVGLEVTPFMAMTKRKHHSLGGPAPALLDASPRSVGAWKAGGFFSRVTPLTSIKAGTPFPSKANQNGNSRSGLPAWEIALAARPVVGAA